MPKIPGLPERPHYNSVKAYLSELAKDISGMVVDPVKMERFREQLKIYADFWKQWSTFDEADRQGCWEPSMGRPECIFNIFSRSYNPLKDIEKEAKRLAGSYALCALIHDNQLPHLDKINTDIIPAEAVEETLSAPRNTLEDRIVGNWNSGPDVREIYLIEEFFNRVNVDLKELCKSEENKLTQASIERQIQKASQLSDKDFLELTAKKFEERAKKVLSKDETWHDLDRSLKGWFDSAIARLEKQGFKDKTDLLKYRYKNLMHYARNINIKSFRGFPDSGIKQLASNQASELSEKFKEFAQKDTVFLKGAKAEIPAIDKRKISETECESPQEIIEVLKNWQKSDKTGKDFEAAKSALPPIAKTYEILCRSRGRCGAKTTDFIRWLGSAANDGSGYCPALLENFASAEVIADLEKWEEKPAETEQEIKSVKKPSEAMTEKDRQLFSQIAIDVREHPNRYSRAGKCLDKYCEEKRQIPQIRRFAEARQDLLKKYEEQDFIPEDDAIRILLITWLLTDADAQKTNPNITQFAGWPWKPTDNITSGSRCAASSLWCKNAYGYDRWMRLVRIAWKTVDTQKPIETEQKAAPAKWRVIWTLVKRIPRWIYVLVIFLAALLTCIYLILWLWTKFSA